MRFEIRFLDFEKYPIDGFIDALAEDKTLIEYHVSVAFLDHRKNLAVLYATGEFGEYIKTNYGRNKSMEFKFPENYHNPFHNSYLDNNGWKICGCGWKESESEHTKRTMVLVPAPTIQDSIVDAREKMEKIRTNQTDTLIMRVVSRSEIPQ